VSVRVLLNRRAASHTNDHVTFLDFFNSRLGVLEHPMGGSSPTIPTHLSEVPSEVKGHLQPDCQALELRARFVNPSWSPLTPLSSKPERNLITLDGISILINVRYTR